jgi:hypothetical protein
VPRKPTRLDELAPLDRAVCERVTSWKASVDAGGSASVLL